MSGVSLHPRNEVLETGAKQSRIERNGAEERMEQKREAMLH